MIAKKPAADAILSGRRFSAKIMPANRLEGMPIRGKVIPFQA